MPEEIIKYTELISKVISRLAKIWEKGEGQLTVKITDDNNVKKAKVEGGEVDRV
jgi:hypothetical protein